MKRNCAKLVTIVGTLPTTSSSFCHLCARTPVIRSVSSCQMCSSSSCSVFYQKQNAINTKSPPPAQYSIISHHRHYHGMLKPLLSSLLHLRTCSPGTPSRSYSSSNNNNAGGNTVEMGMDTSSSSRHHQNKSSEVTIKAQNSSSSLSSDIKTNDNTLNSWTFDSHSQRNSKINSSNYCSTINLKNNSIFSTDGGKSSSSISSPCSNSPSSTSTSSLVTTASLFGMITTSPGAVSGVTSNFTPVRTVATSQRLVEVTRDSIMEQPKLMSKEEREEFMSVYHQLVKELLETPDMKDMEETNRWMARVLQYNVPHGKRNRGLSTALAYKYLAPEELTEDNVRLSYVLGWCVEILQAFFLVSDDIMDGSETRRGRPCWYKVDNLGLAAVNDALLLEATIYSILRKHFSDKPYYAKVMEVMHDVTYKTIFGQSLDTRTGQDRRMETYTMDRYSSIVKYKTSYYSFYLPVALAMTMCEIKDPNLFQQMRKVTLEMGHFFQVQDDFLDCFGDVEVTGKIGTDIQDCKCSWLFVVAMQRCSPEQKKFLLDNYGKHEPEKIQAVKKLYEDLGIEDVYQNYEEQTYNMICTHIQQMSEELPKGLFYDMLQKIYKRSS